MSIVLHVYVGHSMTLVIMPVHRPQMNVVANPRQKVLHCLVASRTLPAEGKKASLQVSVFTSHTLLWRLADQVLCDECRHPAIFLLNGVDECPDGWMIVAHQMKESIVPALALVVCSGFPADSSIMDIPQLGWKSRWHML